MKKYYYNTGITLEVFNGITENASPENESLHKAVFTIIKKYTEKLRENGVDCSENTLPIGFLASSVLSNWCLEKFDQGILDFWNPAYYGRYVDDIIIVEKIEEGSWIYKKASEGALTKEFVIDYYLGGGRRKDSSCFVKKIQETIEDLNDSGGSNKISYRVNTDFCLSDYSTFEFQSDKTRIIALFSENNSTALISKFKQEIFENVSEFRLMPEIGEAFMQDDFSQFYKLDNDATINKLRGIKGISMDKYELSKFLGKYRVVSSLVNDGSIKKFTHIIGKMFNDRELIENYILWERVFEIFITDKDYDGFIKFVRRISLAIEKLAVIPKGSDEEQTVNTSAVKHNLKRHMTATLNRVLSLLWGKTANKIITALGNLKLCLSLRQEYLSNKYVMAVPNEVIKSPVEYKKDEDINFTDFSAGFAYLCGKDGNAYNSEHYKLLPYFRQAQDIASAMLLNSICLDCSAPLKTQDYVDEVNRDMPDRPIKITNKDSLDGYDILSVKGIHPAKRRRI